jgi:hypothetical protein
MSGSLLRSVPRRIIGVWTRQGMEADRLAEFDGLDITPEWANE